MVTFSPVEHCAHLSGSLVFFTAFVFSWSKHFSRHSNWSDQIPCTIGAPESTLVSSGPGCYPANHTCMDPFLLCIGTPIINLCNTVEKVATIASIGVSIKWQRVISGLVLIL